MTITSTSQGSRVIKNMHCIDSQQCWVNLCCPLKTNLTELWHLSTKILFSIPQTPIPRWWPSFGVHLFTKLCRSDRIVPTKLRQCGILARYEISPGFVPTYQHHRASAGTFQSGDQQIHAGTLIDHMVPKSELQELGEPSQWMLNKTWCQ